MFAHRLITTHTRARAYTYVHTHTYTHTHTIHAYVRCTAPDPEITCAQAAPFLDNLDESHAADTSFMRFKYVSAGLYCGLYIFMGYFYIEAVASKGLRASGSISIVKWSY